MKRPYTLFFLSLALLISCTPQRETTVATDPSVAFPHTECAILSQTTYGSGSAIASIPPTDNAPLDRLGLSVDGTLYTIHLKRTGSGEEHDTYDIKIEVAETHHPKRVITYYGKALEVYRDEQVTMVIRPTSTQSE